METLQIDYENNLLKLEKLEEKLIASISLLGDKVELFSKEKSIIENMKEKLRDKIFIFNVSGKIFKTRINTLCNGENTFFSRILLDDELVKQDVIYLDKNPYYFEIFLNFLRFDVIDYSRFNDLQLKALLNEAVYYGIEKVERYIKHYFSTVTLVNFEFSGPYKYNNVQAGTNLLVDIGDKSLRKGICTVSSGYILFELSKPCVLTTLEIGGYNGKIEIWNAEFGAGATILSSEDKYTWNVIGTVPNGFGSEIKTVNLIGKNAKYLKFTSNSYLGIGYLKVFSN